MTFENLDLYLGYDQYAHDLMQGNKISIQGAIMSYGVMIVLACVNVLEKIFIENSKLRLRLLKATVTVVLIYLSNWGIFEILGIRVFSLYYYPRGIPAPMLGLGTIGYVTFILLVFEGFFKTKLFSTIKRLVVKLTGDSLYKNIGWTMFIFNIFWIIRSVHFFLAYNYNIGIFYTFAKPDWVLFLNMIIGLIGVYIGLKIIRKRLSVGIWGMIDLVLLIGSGLVEYHVGYY
ncbi:hypothetical protein [Carboxylicivirga marina]|uniref:Uncharacterized protein n=1 Tax=Carboxylicivirga marina TaxID=2800988 RepID=A0ABS1HLR5_9BACT|nr:hypothetical protein [Carboxylicivirga marina]MBK3518482.1 hypothetical protein [Carboxylicivirga marina]